MTVRRRHQHTTAEAIDQILRAPTICTTLKWMQSRRSARNAIWAVWQPRKSSVSVHWWFYGRCSLRCAYTYRNQTIPTYMQARIIDFLLLLWSRRTLFRASVNTGLLSGVCFVLPCLFVFSRIRREFAHTHPHTYTLARRPLGHGLGLLILYVVYYFLLFQSLRRISFFFGYYYVKTPNINFNMCYGLFA